ncbi:hypothetical protein ACFQ3L_10395 [Lacticaseibacillus jixianensis]|uniref:MacB-like periplasmic core domain-containing protein n=1 Tax=Lacticaseibacillus jixianensis TaxID=2486012 RepID=A0ABW4BAD7_9LACO|nr:hypothetical protein [Lacticaseibacillus jixianensis]
MKRLIVLGAAWFLMILAAGFVWSAHDQTEYAELLDHFNLTEDAVRIKSDARMTLPEAAAKLAKSDLTDFQVQFRASDSRVYLFAKGDYGSLPLASGQWFSDADLASSLPVMVVGQDHAKALTVGSHQQYAKQAGEYIPVLGIISSPRSRRLNAVRFFNASGSEANHLRVSQMTIYADGQQTPAQKRQLARLLGGRAAGYQYRQRSAAGDFWATMGLTLTLCAGLAALAALLAWLTGWFMQHALPAELPLESRHRTLRGLWLRVSGYAAIDTGLGLLAVNWWFYLSNHLRAVLFAVGLWGLAIAVLYVFLMRSASGKDDPA